MKKTRVVHIVEAMLGGIRQHVCDIIENMDSEKYEMFLIYSDRRADDAFYEKMEMLNAHAELIRCNEMHREIGVHDLYAYNIIKKHLERIKPDIIHCHSSKAGIIGRLAASQVKKNIRGVYVIYTPNAYAFQNMYSSKIKNHFIIFVEKFLSKYKTDMTINVSKGEMELALKYKIDNRSKFVLIYNGIPEITIPNKMELKKKLGFNNDRYYIGVTARCARQKDPFTFLTIAEKVIEKNDSVDFVYIGDGELLEDMKSFVRSRKLESRIHLLGFRSDASIIVSIFDIYLSTALYEGLPYSMLEAMRAGIPIIATDTVGNNELVMDGENGKLFEIGNSDKAAKLIEEQIKNKSIKPEIVKTMFMEKFALGTMIRAIETLYENQTKGNK